jgi:hypothetical protein
MDVQNREASTGGKRSSIYFSRIYPLLFWLFSLSCSTIPSNFFLHCKLLLFSGAVSPILHFFTAVNEFCTEYDLSLYLIHSIPTQPRSYRAPSHYF